jgi:hypothetical protein
MADRPTVNGWNNINLNKPEEYSSEFTVDGNRYANVTNVTTGQRQLYLVSGVGGTPLTQRSLLTTTNVDGKVEPGEGYNAFSKSYGLTKLQNAEKANKQQSTKLLSTPGISTKDELAKVKDSKEFKSSLANVGTSAGITTESISPIVEDLEKEQGGTRNKFSLTLKYPENLQAEFQDVIQFSMVKYSPKTFNTGDSESLSAFNERRKINPSGKDKNVIGVVTLPIPGGIGDGNLVDWQSNNLDMIQANLVNIADAAIGGGGEAGANVANTKLDAIKNNRDAIVSVVKSKFTEAATNTTNILSRTRGAVLNPNMELLFNGPQLRPFNFTFKLSPRSKKEAESVRSIIRFFKQGMSPIRTQSNLFLKAPHTFQIQYRHKNEEHKFINKIKECALLSFVVNYTPESNYATFTDGAMVSYEIQMQFTELEPIFNDDYTKIDGNNDTYIGY